MSVIEKLIAALTGPLVQIVSQLIDKWGTKFIIAIGSIGSIVYLVNMYLGLTVQPVEPAWVVVGGCVAIAIVAFGYFFYRSKQEGVVTPNP